MRAIIAGSRDIGLLRVREAMAACPWADRISVVISGGARGADLCGEEWARDHGIPVEQYLADWDRFGKQAGVLRNIQMGNVAEALVAIWDLVSPGTRQMIEYAQKRGLKVFVWSPGLGEVRRTERGWLPLAQIEPEGA